MDKYKKSIQKDLMQLMKDEPTKAHILWQFKMDTDTAQAAYLPDDHLITNDGNERVLVHQNADQGLAIIVRDTEMHRAQQEEAKREQEDFKHKQQVAIHEQEVAKQGQEVAKSEQERYKGMALEAQERTKQEHSKAMMVESQEKAKQVKYEFDMQFKTSKEKEQTARTSATQNGLTLRATEKRKEVDAKARIEAEKEQTKRSAELTKQKAIDYKILLLQQGVAGPEGLDVEEGAVVRPRAKRGRPRKNT
jgi:hypothetical protein